MNMMQTALLASSLILAGIAVSAQSIPEKAGMNSAFGIAPKTQDPRLCHACRAK